MPAFARTIGIDYSGAETPTASLKGLCVYLAEGDAPPVEVPPPPSLKKYWTRHGIAEWLVNKLAEDAPTLVGIDHGFSFPLRYFKVHGHQQRAIAAPKPKTCRSSPQRDIELMTEKQNFAFKPPPRLEQVGDKRCKQAEDRDHRMQ